MKVIPMRAERRTALGRNQVAQLRNDGWMPAVVYGEGGENIAIAIWERIEPKLSRRHARPHRVRLYESPDLYAEYLGEASRGASADGREGTAP